MSVFLAKRCQGQGWGFTPRLCEVHTENAGTLAAGEMTVGSCTREEEALTQSRWKHIYCTPTASEQWNKQWALQLHMFLLQPAVSCGLPFMARSFLMRPRQEWRLVWCALQRRDQSGLLRSYCGLKWQKVKCSIQRGLRVNITFRKGLWEGNIWMKEHWCAKALGIQAGSSKLRNSFSRLWHQLSKFLWLQTADFNLSF